LKKVTLLLFFIFSLVIVPNYSFASNDYSGGLLGGQTLSYGSGYANPVIGYTSYATDNNESTGFTLSHYSTDSFTTDSIFYKFGQPENIMYFKLKTSEDGVNISFKNASGGEIYSYVAAQHDGSLIAFNISGVYGISVYNSTANNTMNIQEMNFYTSTPPTPAPTPTPTPDTTPPLSPTYTINFSTLYNISFSSTRVDPVSDYKGYKIYLNGALYSYSDTTDFNSIGTVISGLSPATTYNIKLTAYDIYGNESSGTLFSMTTQLNTTPPAAPRGLTGTAGDSQASLQWTANSESDFKGYNVYQGGTKLNSNPITGTSYVVAAGLTNGTSYSFTVSAVNTSGYESSKSTAVNLTPQNKIPPAAPIGLTGTAGDSQASLQWTANSESDLKGYNIYQSGTKLNSSPITGTSYIITGLTNTTSYSFTVSAVNTSGFESVKSAAVNVVPLNMIPPAIPAGLTATSGDTQVYLNWTANSENDLKGYNVYYKTVKLNSSPITGTAYTVKNLTNGTSYSFTISAINTSNVESNKSSPQSATPEPPPAIPIGLSATPGDSQVTLHWIANTEMNLKGYFIYLNGTKVNNLPFIATSYTIASGLTNGTAYSFAISAIDADGYQSARSVAINATPIDLTPPAIPSGLTAIAGNAQATLQWAENTESDLKGYNVYQGTTILNGSPITGTSYIITGLTNATSYGFTISSIDLSGNESAKTATTTVMPMAVPPPTGLTASNDLIAIKVILTWDMPAQTTTYIIYRNGVQAATSTTPTYTDTTVSNGQSYSYDVVAVDTMGNQSIKSNVKTYFSKSATDFSSGGSGFSASDVVRNASSFLLLFVGFIVLIASIRFAPQLQNFFFSLLNVIKNNGVLKEDDRNSKRGKIDLKTIKETNALKPLKRGYIQKIDRTKQNKETREPILKEKREPRPRSTKIAIPTIQKRDFEKIHKDTVKKRAGRSVVPKIKRKRGLST
jgi:fibronectin type 3 domain-containing protein